MKSRLVSKNANDNFGIPGITNTVIIFKLGDDEDGGTGEEQGVTVIDVVDAHRLKEIELDKKAWTGYIKGISLEWL